MTANGWTQGAVVAVLAIGLAALFTLTGAWQTPEHHASFSRPDGKFTIEVLRKPSWRATLPGQGSDSPGEVQLLDAQRRVLQRADLPMVQLVDRVVWGDKRVSIPLVADWALPD